MRATLHDELMHEAGYDVPSLETRERRRLWRRRLLGRDSAFFGVAVIGAVAAGVELLDHGGRLTAGGVVGVVFGVGGFLASRRKESRR